MANCEVCGKPVDTESEDPDSAIHYKCAGLEDPFDNEAESDLGKVD